MQDEWVGTCKYMLNHVNTPLIAYGSCIDFIEPIIDDVYRGYNG